MFGSRCDRYFRKAAEGFNAFVEGWALYTEKLAREFGFFATEPDGSEGYDVWWLALELSLTDLGPFAPSRLDTLNSAGRIHLTRANAGSAGSSSATLATS